MSRPLTLLVALTAQLVWTAPAHAAQSAGFKPLCMSYDCPAAPLRGAEFKTVLLEFFDPTASQIAEPLTYLWYRQIYDSVSDVSKARIVRLVGDGGEPTKDYTQTLIFNARGNHNLADHIASNSDAQLAVWGTLLSLNKNQISYAPSITAPNDTQMTWLQVPGSAAANATEVPTPLVKLDRVNLSARASSLSELYGTSVFVRCSRQDGCPQGTVLLQSEPRDQASGPALSEGERLTIDISDSRRPTGKHVPVKLADGRAGWLYAYHIALVPGQAYISSRSTVPVYASAATNSARIGTITGPTLRKVTDAPLIGPARSATRWYRIELQPEQYGWVQFGAVRPVWAADFVHFVAGLQHYGRGRFNGAHDEMELFVSRANPDEDNVAISVAYEIMAASIIASRSQPGPADLEQARRYISASVDATPFDSRSYFLRAYSTLAWRKNRSLTSDSLTSIKADVAAAEKYLLDTDDELGSALKRMQFVVDE